jgi:hypothetical protein
MFYSFKYMITNHYGEATGDDVYTNAPDNFSTTANGNCGFECSVVIAK